MATIPYKSFCWSFGTTSFRTKDFNRTIEQQLFLLSQFWIEHHSENWQGNNLLQEQYYDFMHSQGFLTGEAGNKPKDAREKTSGLVDIGLIYDNRKLTPAGEILLKISRNADFQKDGFFNISKDSIIYLKQLLKTYYKIEKNTVRPFIVILYVLLKLEYVSFDEFAYIIPLCTSEIYTGEIIENILKLRQNKIKIDDVIYNKLISMDNYNNALNLFIENNVTEDLICEIGLNRKSRNYDKPYYQFYCSMYDFYVNKKIDVLSQLLSNLNKLNLKKWWKNYIFGHYSEKQILNNLKKCKNITEFDEVFDEITFKQKFFKMMHIFKAKATLLDYFDLNVRYIKTADILLFSDNKISLDIIPKYFFQDVIDELYQLAYTQSDNLFDYCDFHDISQCFDFDENKIISAVNQEFSTNIVEINEAKKLLEQERYKKLRHLIDTKFTDEKIIELLDDFEQRNDINIRNFVTDNADIPTIFEYIIGILWFKVSEYKGDILDYMKLSLDADLLPKSHACGGTADIIYEYEKSNYYPNHSLLIEVTLSDKNNQRRMEMEPVSRHLGDYLIKTKNKNSYCVFATNYLNINVISDFRSRKNFTYYNTENNDEFIESMKIIPLQSSELKQIISNKITYKQLYEIFEKAFHSTLTPVKWYQETIVEKLQSNLSGSLKR